MKHILFAVLELESRFTTDKTTSHIKILNEFQDRLSREKNINIVNIFESFNTTDDDDLIKIYILKWVHLSQS